MDERLFTSSHLEGKAKSGERAVSPLRSEPVQTHEARSGDGRAGGERAWLLPTPAAQADPSLPPQGTKRHSLTAAHTPALPTLRPVPWERAHGSLTCFPSDGALQAWASRPSPLQPSDSGAGWAVRGSPPGASGPARLPPDGPFLPLPSRGPPNHQPLTSGRFPNDSSFTVAGEWRGEPQGRCGSHMAPARTTDGHGFLGASQSNRSRDSTS